MPDEENISDEPHRSSHKQSIHLHTDIHEHIYGEKEEEGRWKRVRECWQCLDMPRSGLASSLARKSGGSRKGVVSWPSADSVPIRL